MLYKVTVRSVIDFALPVYYHSLKMSDKNYLEQVQYKGAKLTTGALHGSSMIKLNSELGLESIATRADFLSLNVFHKILVGNTRPLIKTCMPPLAHNHDHNIRQRNIFTSSHTASVKFKNSFFPTISKKYQSLPKSCRTKVDIDLFKEELREHLVPKRYKFLARGSKIGCKLLTQIRVGRSYLNSHSYSVGKSLSPQCSCHFPTESTSHYILDCFLNNEERRSLLSTYEQFIPKFPSFSKKKQLQTILYGYDIDNTEFFFNKCFFTNCNPKIHFKYQTF